jgi:UDP-GlcNAc3NAcA epimerase
VKNIVTVVGARPQFIKASPVSRALREAGIVESIIHTGQHSDANMSEVFFNEMEIPKPEHFLGVSGLTHGAMTGEMLRRIEEILIAKKPDAVLVYGDTNSTLAGALAASKLHIPVAHVEAGLRSFNMRMPEEINRTVTDRISKWLFCPTAAAVKNLELEGYRSPAFFVENVGDVMFDATLHFKKKARWPRELPEALRNKPFVLCTLHRQESTEDPQIFAQLLEALAAIATEMPVVWPVHPRARKTMEARGLKPAGLTLISPVGYLEMLALLDACALVTTDSGGLQKEAFFFGKHCLTLRTETEWVELVELGKNTLCGHSVEKIKSKFATHRSDSAKTAASLPYGKGDAANKIARLLKEY